MLSRTASRLIQQHGTRTIASLQHQNKPHTIFSGIRPTGMPHLGNFLGALQNWVKLQRDSTSQDKLLFSITRRHSLARRDMLAALLAIGLDPNSSIIFHQDENPHHVELAWLFNCITPIGKLRHMTTWKAQIAASRNANDESEVDESMLNAGLFTYPVLQSADILLYKATHVPAGEDQKQHLELARDIGDTFNRTFGTLFPLPEYVATPTRRLLPLKDPSSKMSKSSPDQSSRILLTDTDAQIQTKIRAAVTDSIRGVTYDPSNRPGTSNLLTILAACTDEDVTDVAKRYKAKGHGELKADVAAAVLELMRKPRSEFERLRAEPVYLQQVARDGAEKAQVLSEETIKQVRTMVGLV
ncbi:tryptophanyl-tRNA synthetase [Trametopsis cervina]|nr:tryptophanyl-tRNA synthetase [Trametopsis cervina]